MRLAVVVNAADTLTKCLGSKIQNQPAGLIEQLYIGLGLANMDTSKLFQRLNLNNTPAINEQIDAVRVIKFHTIYRDVHRHLPGDLKANAFQTARQNRFVHRFQQPRPQFLVQVKSRINDLGYMLLLRLIFRQFTISFFLISFFLLRKNWHIRAKQPNPAIA